MVLDSDDLMHPDRLERLITAAERDGADLVADDMVVFADAEPAAAHRFFGPARAAGPAALTLPDYLRETRMLVSKANLGYLKPLIRLDALRAAGVRYDEALRIAEDDDLLCRLLDAGLKARLYPDLGYLYRKHPSSISHRLSEATVGRIVAQEQRFRAALRHPTPQVLAALDGRRAAALTAQAFVALVDALKARRFGAALRVAARRPQALALLRLPLAAALGRRLPRRPRGAEASAGRDPRAVCVISRQRLTGAVNGSSTYLLDLARALKGAGFAPHLVQPSPVILGRWPYLKLKPEMDVFASVHIRGVARAGPWVIARDPAVWLAAARGVAAQALARARLPHAWLGARPAPYAIAAPWRDDDRLYVARHAPPLAGAGVVLDYLFQTEALPYVLRPDSPSAVVMHDLFHPRAEAFAAQGAADSVAGLDAAAEARLLGRADAVIAIQAREGAWVRAHAPHVCTLVAPMAAHPAPAPAPGRDDLLLFVGSNTAPNVIGLEWFFAEAWPRLRALRPAARLQVAGSVGRALRPPEGVEVLGVVDDLAGAYARAGVVISPLTAGSGLKIKLIEAMAAGKAVVATSVTLQGVEAEAGPAVAHHDAPHAFAEAAAALAGDAAAREALGALALEAARAHFSAEACYGETVRWFAGAASPEPQRPS